MRIDPHTPYIKSPTIRAQIRQLKYANSQTPRRERNRFSVTTYSKTAQIRHNKTVAQRVKKFNLKPVIAPKRLDNKALKGIYDQYLSNWTISIRATLVNGVFFKNYHQAYNALNRMVDMGLLTKDGADYFSK